MAYFIVLFGRAEEKSGKRLSIFTSVEICQKLRSRFQRGSANPASPPNIQTNEWRGSSFQKPRTTQCFVFNIGYPRCWSMSRALGSDWLRAGILPDRSEHTGRYPNCGS